MSDHNHTCGPGCSHDHHHAGREVPDFPTEVIFKVICRNGPHIQDTLRSILSEMGIVATIGNRESKKATFISYTVTGVFPSEEVLQRTCSAIATIDGVMTIF